MCWIFAYNWTEDSIPFLIEWLRNLEYRWYDSAWIVWVNADKEIYIEKAVWKVSNLATKIEKNLYHIIDVCIMLIRIIPDFFLKFRVRILNLIYLYS